MLSHGGGGEQQRFYANTFRAIDAPSPGAHLHAQAADLRRHQRAVEPHAEEIGKHAEIDEQGRYPVRFFSIPRHSAPASARRCPVRMAQPHAGPNYGFHFPLKPGIEVLVGFTDGDPRPAPHRRNRAQPHHAVPGHEAELPVQPVQTVSGIFMELKDV